MMLKVQTYLPPPSPPPPLRPVAKLLVTFYISICSPLCPSNHEKDIHLWMSSISPSADSQYMYWSSYKYDVQESFGATFHLSHACHGRAGRYLVMRPVFQLDGNGKLKNHVALLLTCLHPFLLYSCINYCFFGCQKRALLHHIGYDSRKSDLTLRVKTL